VIVPVVLLMVGLAVLVAGGEALVRGGGRLGRALGLSPLVVGLTIVAFATSAPELAVSVDATLSGSAGLAVGNVVGSNITNILLVLGVAALLLPVAVRSQMLRRDVPVMVGLSILLLALSMSGTISRFEGAALVTLLVVYLAWSVTVARTAKPSARPLQPTRPVFARSTSPWSPSASACSFWAHACSSPERSRSPRRSA
jgi:cation:H+ antiporter